MSNSDPSAPDDGVIQQFNDSDFAFGRVVVPVPNLNKPPRKGKLGVEYTEHSYIGDSIELVLAGGGRVAASSHKFRLPNGLTLTYGQINALAGDFYGTHHPISDGKSSQDRSARFLAAYNTLANGNSRQPEEANDILAVLQAEIDAVNNALINHQDPSVVYSTLPDVTSKLEQITSGRSDIPSYIELAKINWDHFGEDARTVYNVGHGMAIQKAIDGDLESAYALNAFADHFLEDTFSSGNLRTPRRSLHGAPGLSADICAKLMHDEDCAIGLRVENPVGESWECYGDKQALNEVAAENLKRCVAAVQASADEIYTAYLTKRAPSPSIYAAWRIAPTLESARSPSQALTTLFTPDWRRRRDIKARKTWIFEVDSPFVAALECKSSGYWNPPITIDGIHSTIPWSGISAATQGNWLLRVFYQVPSGAIVQIVWHSRWTRPHDQPLVSAVLFTPLASITWNEGTEVRLYYLDPEYILREHCYSEGIGWFAGEIGQLNLKTSVNTRIAAFRHDFDGSDHIRVYCQEAGSRAIIELSHDRNWARGSRLPDALDGTSIAAVVYKDDTGAQYRVYYQTEDLFLREHCFSHGGKEWFPGGWNPCKAPGRSPINAVAYTQDSCSQLHVYWCNAQDEIVTNKTTVSGWGPVTKVLGGITSGSQFALLSWEQGKRIRIYYQSREGVPLEHGSDDGGEAWFPGAQLGNFIEQA